ncbi:adenosylmethionine decarboxylase [Enterococcus sp. LJL128]
MKIEPTQVNIAKIIKEQTKLEESEEVVHLLLIEWYLRKQLSTKKLAGKVKLPLPLVSAIKKELVKLGLASNKVGTSLTRKGKLYVEQQLGWAAINKEYYLKVTDSKEEQASLKEVMTEELTVGIVDRPSVAVAYDQAFATIETIVERAFLLLEKPDFINKHILFLGDDDLSSLAVGLLIKKLKASGRTKSTEKLTVYELSPDVIHCINTSAKKMDLDIVCQHLDFREGSLSKYKNQFDYIYVDPPYTLSGLKLFLSRAVSCSRLEHAHIFLSFGEKAPKKQLALQKLIGLQNLVIEKIKPKFNQYSGASILGGVSTLYELTTQIDSYPAVLAESSYSDYIYTGELRPRNVVYQCCRCGKEYTVGLYTEMTIEELKRKKCSICANDTFLRIDTKKLPDLQEQHSLGKHYLIELKNCPKEKLTSVPLVEQLMLQIADECKLTRVQHYFHQFEPWGVSGVIILAESHLTIHTWPEENYAAVDLFVCSDLPSESHFTSLLLTLFEGKEIECRRFSRGNVS